MPQHEYSALYMYIISEFTSSIYILKQTTYKGVKTRLLFTTNFILTKNTARIHPDVVPESIWDKKVEKFKVPLHEELSSPFRCLCFHNAVYSSECITDSTYP